MDYHNHSINRLTPEQEVEHQAALRRQQVQKVKLHQLMDSKLWAVWSDILKEEKSLLWTKFKMSSPENLPMLQGAGIMLDKIMGLAQKKAGVSTKKKSANGTAKRVPDIL